MNKDYIAPVYDTKILDLVSEDEIQGYVDAAEIQGVEVIDGVACGEAGGHWFPVIAAIRYRNKLIPVLDIPMMDEQPNRKEVAE